MRARKLAAVLGAAALAVILLLLWLRRSTPPGPGPAGGGAEIPLAELGRVMPAPPLKSSSLARVTPVPDRFSDTSMNGEPINRSRFGEPNYMARVWRSRNTLVYLRSPIRNSPEIQQLAALCRTYGYGPWAVAAAYWIAYENRAKEEMLRDWPDVGPEYRQVTAEIQDMLWQGRSQEYAQRLNVIAWDPRFIEEVRKVKPREFIGHHASEFMDDQVLIDAMTWEEAAQAGEGPGPHRRKP